MKTKLLPGLPSGFRSLLNLLSLSGVLALSASSAWSATINFGVSDIVSDIAIGTSAETTVTGAGKTYTSSIAFSTTTAYLLNTDASYNGPDIYGGAYRQQVYATAQTENPGGWYETRTNLGIYSRRNGPNGVAESGSALTIRLGSLFDAGGSFTLDSSSSFSFTLVGGSGSNAANTANYLFLQSGSDLYRSVVEFESSASSQGLGSLGTASFQKVTVDSSTLALTNSGGTVLGSTLSDITKAGFFVEIVSTGESPGSPSPSITEFKANFAPVPEPSSSILLLGGLTGMLFLRLRRD